MSNRLRFPLVGKDNRPIYDAAGKLVSITENAELFLACANLVHEFANAGSSIDVLDMAQRATKIMEHKP